MRTCLFKASLRTGLTVCPPLFKLGSTSELSDLSVRTHGDPFRSGVILEEWAWLFLSVLIVTILMRIIVLGFSRLVIIAVLVVMPAFVHAGQFPESAPSFTLTDLHGKSVSLAEFRDKIVFLVFWASWCAPCREELPELDLIYKKFKREGFEVIAVSVDVSDAAVVNFLRKFPVSFTVLLDKQGDVNDAYRVSGLPAAFMIGRKGIIRHVHIGFSKGLLTTYENEIADLIKQK